MNNEQDTLFPLISELSVFSASYKYILSVSERSPLRIHSAIH